MGEAYLGPFTTGMDIACSREVLSHWTPKDLSLYYGFSRLQLDLPIREQAPGIQEGHTLYFGSFKNRIPEQLRNLPSRTGPRGSAQPSSGNTSQNQRPNDQNGSSGRQAATEGVRLSAFRRLTPLSAAVPSSPSWGSADSSGRKFHGNVSTANSSINLTNQDTSSGEYTIRSASLATPEPEQEQGPFQDEEPDTKAEERGESALLEQPIGELLAARGLQYLAPTLDVIGIGKVADLSCIYMKDLLEDGIEESETLKLLHGFETCGAIRSFQALRSFWSR